MTAWIVAHQTSLSMGFSKQEFWSGLPFPLLGNPPGSGIEPASPAPAGGFFTAEPPLCAQSCPTLGDPMGCSLPGSSVPGIFQARMLEWVAISYSMGHQGSPQIVWGTFNSFFFLSCLWDLSCLTRDRTQAPGSGPNQSPNYWTAREVLGTPFMAVQERVGKEGFLGDPQSCPLCSQREC